MENKTFNPLEKAFSGLTKPSVLSAIASVAARNLKGRMVQELAGQASDQIKEIDQTRDLLVQGVYERFREQVKALTEGRADGLETPSAAMPPGITHEGNTIMSHPSSSLHPLGYFLPAPESSDSNLFLKLEKQVFPSALTTRDMAELVILCLKESVVFDDITIETHWAGDEISCWVWYYASELTPEAKLRLALDLLNQMVYAGR